MADTSPTRDWVTVSMRVPTIEAEKLRALAKASTRSVASQSLHYIREGMAREGRVNPFLRRAGEHEEQR
jgi:hypothetical protein